MALRENLSHGVTSASQFGVLVNGSCQSVPSLPPLAIPLHIPFGGSPAFHSAMPRDCPQPSNHRPQHDGRITGYHGGPQQVSVNSADMAALEEFQKRRNLEQLELARLAKNVASLQGHSGPPGREHRDRALSARLRERIYDSYVGYLGWLQEQQALGRDEDAIVGAGPAKQKRHQLEELINDYVCQVSHREKYHLGLSFELILRQTIERRSGGGGQNFDPLRTAEAFRWLERYACNLLVQPWREEFRKIKLYGGFYKHKIERYICQPEAVLELLGYVRQGHCMVLPPKPLDPDDVTFVALDCLIANVECKILLLLKSGVRHFDSRWMDIYNTRCQLHGASISECAVVLNHQYEQKLHSQRALESMYNEMENLGYGAGGRLGENKDSRLDKIVVTTPFAPSRKAAQRHQPKTGSMATSTRVGGTNDDDDRRFRGESLIDEGFARNRGNYREEGGGKRVPSNNPFQVGSSSQMGSQHLSREKASLRTSGASNNYKLLLPTEQSSSSGVAFALPKLGPSPTPPLGASSSQHVASTMTSSQGSVSSTQTLLDDESNRSRDTKENELRKRERESRARDLMNDHRDETDGKKAIDTWSCAFCTFINEPTVNICAMCSKTRNLYTRSPADDPLISGGRECSTCMFINPKSATRCEVCESCLNNSPTYI